MLPLHYMLQQLQTVSDSNRPLPADNGLFTPAYPRSINKEAQDFVLGSLSSLFKRHPGHSRRKPSRQSSSAAQSAALRMMSLYVLLVFIIYYTTYISCCFVNSVCKYTNNNDTVKFILRAFFLLEQQIECFQVPHLALHAVRFLQFDVAGRIYVVHPQPPPILALDHRVALVAGLDLHHVVGHGLVHHELLE